MATNMSNPGSAEEKLKWIFEMYDEDGSGMMVVNKAECSILCRAWSTDLEGVILNVVSILQLHFSCSYLPLIYS